MPTITCGFVCRPADLHTPKMLTKVTDHHTTLSHPISTSPASTKFWLCISAECHVVKIIRTRTRSHLNSKGLSSLSLQVVVVVVCSCEFFADEFLLLVPILPITAGSDFLSGLVLGYFFKILSLSKDSCKFSLERNIKLQQMSTFERQFSLPYFLVSYSRKKT